MKLTKEQITEGNEKLAKFLEWYQEPNGEYLWFEKGESAIYVAYDDLPFHKDWNYLMKVVDKIGTIVYHSNDDAPDYNWKEHYSFGELFVNIFTKWLRYCFEEHKQEFNLMNDLTSIWCGCVAYVDWYNKEKLNM